MALYLITNMKNIKNILLLLSINLWLINCYSQNYALYFDGHSSWANINGVYEHAPNNFTVEWWIKPLSTIDYNNRIQGGYGNWDSTFIFHTESNGSIYCGNDLNTRFTPYEISVGTFETNVWQHFAFVYNSGTATLYKNGIPIANKNNVPQSGVWGNFLLGYPWAFDGYIHGIIDELRVWEIARSQVDINTYKDVELTGNEIGLHGYWHFNDTASVATDFSQNQNHGNLYNTQYTINDNPNFSGNAQPMVIDSVYAMHPVVGLVSPGEKQLNAFLINIKTTGMQTPLTLNSISTNITADNLQDIDSIALYYSGFSGAYADNNFIQKLEVNNSTFQFNNNTTLSVGDNRFWLVLEINENADQGNSFDLLNNIITINDSNYIVSNANPAGDFTIKVIPQIHLGQSIWFDEPADASKRQPWLNENQYVLTNPEPAWEEQCLPIGNSYLGAMVYGSIYEERLQFNEKSVWDGGPNVANYTNPNKANSYTYLSQIRNLMISGDTASAHALAKTHLKGNWSSESDFFGNYQTFGDIIIKTGLDKNRVSNYKRVLSFDSAIAKIQFSIADTLYQRRYFCSYPDKIMVMNFTADKQQAQNLEFYFETPHNHTIQSTANGIVLIANLANNNMEIVARVNVFNSGGQVDIQNNRIIVSNSDYVTFVLAADTDYKPEYPTYTGTNPQQTTQDILQAVESKSYQDFYYTHVSDYTPLYNRMALEINNEAGSSNTPTDERLAYYKSDNEDFGLEALLFHYGRYLMISSSRPGDLPANLQGVWNNRLYPGWNSDYHLNINLQMDYWVPDVCNLSECMQPLVDYVDMLREPGAETAQNYFNADGWCTNLVSNTFGYTAPSAYDNMYWSYYPLSGAWLCQNLWDHFEFTQNKTYLEQKIYPIIKSQADFIMDYLYELNDSTLVSCPSWSPEHGPISIGVTSDHAMAYDLLANVIEASTILELDSIERISWVQAKNKIAPLQIGQYGQLQEWYEDIDNPNDHHRHVAHLFALHPGKQISPITTPDLANAAKVTLEHRGDFSTGWSMAWKTVFWSRLFDGDHAYSLLQMQIKNEMLPNLLDKCEILFNIDGNFGATAGIAEMLIQSHLDTIHLLPALPSAWHSGKVNGICARGGFELDFEWQNNEFTDGYVTSISGNICRIKFDDCYIEFPTIAGNIYHLSCDSVTTNINKTHDNSEINVYPNPNNGTFEIKIDDVKSEYNVIIRDIHGCVVYNEVRKNKYENIVVNNLKQGVYVLQINMDNKVFVKKICINK